MILLQKLYNLLPNSYPIACEDGWLLKVNENETRITCSNELCPIDNSLKLAKAIDLLDLPLDVGPNRALEITRKLELSYPMEIFPKVNGIIRGTELEPTDLNSYDIRIINTIYQFITSGIKIPLHKYIQCWGLSQLGATNSQKVFIGVNDLHDFYDKNNTREKIAHFISRKLGISSTSNTVIIITDFLLRYRDDLLHVASFFNFETNDTDIVIHITITGEVLSKTPEGERYKPRHKFAESLTRRYGIPVMYTNHIGHETDVLICDNPKSSHTKIRKVRNNPKFKNIRVMTSFEFEDFIRKQAGGLIYE